jgi:hypothetical protein
VNPEFQMAVHITYMASPRESLINGRQGERTKTMLEVLMSPDEPTRIEGIRMVKGIGVWATDQSCTTSHGEDMISRVVGVAEMSYPGIGEQELGLKETNLGIVAYMSTMN